MWGFGVLSDKPHPKEKIVSYCQIAEFSNSQSTKVFFFHMRRQMDKKWTILLIYLPKQSFENLNENPLFSKFWREKKVLLVLGNS
jgi:hypothetical protein